MTTVNSVENDEDTRVDHMRGERVDQLFDAAVSKGEDEAVKLDTSVSNDADADADGSNGGTHGICGDVLTGMDMADDDEEDDDDSA